MSTRTPPARPEIRRIRRACTCTTASSSTTTSCPSGGSSRSTARSSSRWSTGSGAASTRSSRPTEAYAREMAVQHAAEAEQARKRGVIDDAVLATLGRDPATIGQGKAIFTATCAPCHRADGGREHRPEPDRQLLAPRRASRSTSTTRSTTACPPRECPPGGPQLGEERVETVVAYVLSIRDTNVPGGKAPQGARDRVGGHVRAPADRRRADLRGSAGRRAAQPHPAGRRARSLPPGAHRSLRAPHRRSGRRCRGSGWARHPAVFVDVESHELFLFGTTFNPQDTWLLFFLLSGVGFGLVYATALAGRVWCGWACPQTVFLDGVYRRIERWIEGPRERRIRRNAGPMTPQKVGAQGCDARGLRGRVAARRAHRPQLLRFAAEDPRHDPAEPERPP